MSRWRSVGGQLSGLGNALAASLPQELVAYFRLVPRVLVSRAGVAGAAGSNPAATLFSCLPCVARRRLWKESVLTPEWAQPRRRSRPGDEGKPSGFSLISLWPTSVWCPGSWCLGLAWPGRPGRTRRQLCFLPPLLGKENAFGKSPSLHRNGRSRVGEADPAMRENHPGFPSYLCGLLPFGAPGVAVSALGLEFRAAA